MTIPDDAPATRADLSAHRRWIIGIVISVVFGTFGAVMAYLSYTHDRNDRAPAASTPARAPQAEPEKQPDPAGDGKHGGGKHGHDRKDN